LLWPEAYSRAPLSDHAPLHRRENVLLGRQLIAP